VEIWRLVSCKIYGDIFSENWLLRGSSLRGRRWNGIIIREAQDARVAREGKEEKGAFSFPFLFLDPVSRLLVPAISSFLALATQATGEAEVFTLSFASV